MTAPSPFAPRRGGGVEAAVGRRVRAPDLVFQGSTARTGTGSNGGRKVPRRGLDVFLDGPGFGARPRDRRMAGLAALLALLALPVLVLSVPVVPAEATPGFPASGDLVMDQVVTSIVPRGAGAVLTVEGRIRNPSGRVAAVPPVRIALAGEDGARRSRTLVAGVPSLSPGRSVRFHSAIAVAKDSRGDVEVDLLAPPAPSGKTSIE